VNVLYQLEAALIWQRNIHYQQIWQDAFDAAQSFTGRIGLRFHGKVGLMLNKLSQAFTHHWVIVHNEYAFFWLG